MTVHITIKNEEDERNQLVKYKAYIPLIKQIKLDKQYLIENSLYDYKERIYDELSDSFKDFLYKDLEDLVHRTTYELLEQNCNNIETINIFSKKILEFINNIEFKKEIKCGTNQK